MTEEEGYNYPSGVQLLARTEEGSPGLYVANLSDQEVTIPANSVTVSVEEVEPVGSIIREPSCLTE